MKSSALVFLLALFLLLVACGTRPPAPPDCDGPLTPINISKDISHSGAVDVPERRP